jgi:trans-aconitate 2-methyltransferase
MPREWDAGRYDAQPLPHLGWGLRTIERLGLNGDETVLDAGCGTGRDAATLLERLPAGRVVAVDGSVRMLERARERLADHLDRVEIVLADLSLPLPIAGPVDAVLSVAAFHWVPDHDVLFRNLAAVLRPGGRMAVDCGGLGNIAGVSAVVQEVTQEAQVVPSRPSGADSTPWNFAGVEQTRDRLAAAGFTDLDVQLRPDPVRLAGPAELDDYLLTVVLGAQLDRMPREQHSGFVNAVVERMPEPVIDYVRLEISAVRA